MKLTIQNIGKIHDKATFEINGITVLTGVNGAGKSTVGKVLFSVFNAFYQFESQIYEEKVSSIRRILRNNVVHGKPYPRNGLPQAKIEQLVDEYENKKDIESVKRWCEAFSNDNGYAYNDGLTDGIVQALMVSDEDILKRLVQRRLYEEFNFQVQNVNWLNEEALIDIQIKNDGITIGVDNETNVEIKRYINIVKNIVYLDDPYTLDSMNDVVIRGVDYNHRRDVVEKLIGKDDQALSAVDDVLISNQLGTILAELNKVCGGELQFQANNGYCYKDKQYKEGISITNLSAGLKSYVVLKTLLQNGYIENGGIIILDEPEIHLHPEWMKIYAELVALLQKTLSLNIIISTHNADFLSFLELSCKRNNIWDKCNFYLFKDKGDASSQIEDVTEDISVIYKELGEPFIKVSEELDRLNENN